MKNDERRRQVHQADGLVVGGPQQVRQPRALVATWAGLGRLTIGRGAMAVMRPPPLRARAGTRRSTVQMPDMVGPRDRCVGAASLGCLRAARSSSPTGAGRKPGTRRSPATRRAGSARGAPGGEVDRRRRRAHRRRGPARRRRGPDRRPASGGVAGRSRCAAAAGCRRAPGRSRRSPRRRRSAAPRGSGRGGGAPAARPRGRRRTRRRPRRRTPSQHAQPGDEPLRVVPGASGSTRASASALALATVSSGSAASMAVRGTGGRLRRRPAWMVSMVMDQSRHAGRAGVRGRADRVGRLGRSGSGQALRRGDQGVGVVGRSPDRGPAGGRRRTRRLHDAGAHAQHGHAREDVEQVVVARAQDDEEGGEGVDQRHEPHPGAADEQDEHEPAPGGPRAVQRGHGGELVGDGIRARAARRRPPPPGRRLAHDVDEALVGQQSRRRSRQPVEADERQRRGDHEDRRWQRGSGWGAGRTARPAPPG